MPFFKSRQLDSNNNNNNNSNNNEDKSVLPIYDDGNQPLNYLIVIDAGSKGSRAYLYSWKSLKYHLSNNLIDFDNNNLSFDDFLPNLIYEKHWHKRIKPSIENSIIEFGLHNSYIFNYLDHLIAKIYNLIPIEQHYRTPILFHATAGLRALDPILQSKILDKICFYFNEKTNFYLPDCQSHINILDGDIEGLYSWITLNYLLNNNNKISNKNFQTFGLLELGGGSAQICFEPSIDQIEIHSIQLLNLQLNQNFKLFSTSFLGYGLNQFHHDYLLYLIQNYSSSNNNNKKKNIIADPCLPKDYSNKISFNSNKYIITGSSNFKECIQNIYSVIGDNDEQCKLALLNDSNNNNDLIKTSKCMLSPMMPNFNLDKDHFIAISGYWDTITQLLDFTNQDKDIVGSNSVIYHPDIFTKTTENICNMDFDLLSNLNKNSKLTKDEISNLCFKSTYITALLHSGYALPLNDNIANIEDNKNSTENHLLLNDKINNFKFSWTLGRALLYAYDESAREFYHFFNNSLTELPDNLRIGYFRNSSPTLFHHGSEQNGIPNRPDFELMDNYPTFTFNINNVKGTKTITNPVQTTMDYYYDFDNGYNEDDDSNFDDEYDNFIDNNGFNNNNNNNEDETELVYQTSNNSFHLLKFLFFLFIIFLILFLIPSTKNLIIKFFKRMKRTFSSCLKLNQYTHLINQNDNIYHNNSNNDNDFNQNNENNLLNGNLRKFHINNNNHKDNVNNNNNNKLNVYYPHASSLSTDKTDFSDDSYIDKNNLASLELQNLDFNNNNNNNNNSDNNNYIQPWKVDNHFHNDVVEDLDFEIDENWDNDSDGIERAV